ncbi:MFS transporter [Paenibacillus marinisediminis]
MSNQTSLWTRHFIAACLSNFFMFISHYILIVTLPIFVMDSLHGGQEQVGMIMTTFVLTTVIFRPLAGKWLDDRDKKKILMIGLGVYLVCMILYSFVHSYTVMLALRLVHGIGFGIAATATGAIATDLVPTQRKGEGIGYFGLFMSLAMVIGPFVGLTIIQHYNSGVMFMVCILFTALSFISALMVKPAASNVHQKLIEPATGWRKFIEPNAVSIAIAGGLVAFAYSGITAYVSVYAKELGLSAASSYFFMVFALLIVLSRPFTGKMFDRRGPHVLVYPGVLLFALGIIGLGQMNSAFMLLALAALLGLGYGAILPSFQTIAVKSSPPNRTGLATATYFLFFDIGFGIGSMVLGTIASASGYRMMYVLAGIVVLFAAPIYYWFNHRRRSHNALQHAG